MVQRGIRNHANAALGGHFGQLLEIRIGTEMGIDILVVGRVVLVIAGGRKHGGQVNRIGTEVSNVIQLFNHACKIAAEEIIVEGIVGPVISARFVWPIHPVAMKFYGTILIAINAGFRVVARITVTKAIRKNIVINRVTRPRWHHEIGRVDRMPQAANALSIAGHFLNLTDAIAAVFARPKNGVAVILVNELPVVYDYFKVVAVNANILDRMPGRPAFILPVASPHHGNACNLGVLELFLIAF